MSVFFITSRLKFISRKSYLALGPKSQNWYKFRYFSVETRRDIASTVIQSDVFYESAIASDKDIVNPGSTDRAYPSTAFYTNSMQNLFLRARRCDFEAISKILQLFEEMNSRDDVKPDLLAYDIVMSTEILRTNPEIRDSVEFMLSKCNMHFRCLVDQGLKPNRAILNTLMRANSLKTFSCTYSVLDLFTFYNVTPDSLTASELMSSLRTAAYHDALNSKSITRIVDFMISNSLPLDCAHLNVLQSLPIRKIIPIINSRFAIAKEKTLFQKLIFGCLGDENYILKTDEFEKWMNTLVTSLCNKEITVDPKLFQLLSQRKLIVPFVLSVCGHIDSCYNKSNDVDSAGHRMSLQNVFDDCLEFLGNSVKAGSLEVCDQYVDLLRQIAAYPNVYFDISTYRLAFVALKVVLDIDKAWGVKYLDVNDSNLCLNIWNAARRHEGFLADDVAYTSILSALMYKLSKGVAYHEIFADQFMNLLDEALKYEANNPQAHFPPSVFRSALGTLRDRAMFGFTDVIAPSNLCQHAITRRSAGNNSNYMDLVNSMNIDAYTAINFFNSGETVKAHSALDSFRDQFDKMRYLNKAITDELFRLYVCANLMASFEQGLEALVLYERTMKHFDADCALSLYKRIGQSLTQARSKSRQQSLSEWGACKRQIKRLFEALYEPYIHARNIPGYAALQYFAGPAGIMDACTECISESWPMWYENLLQMRLKRVRNAEMNIKLHSEKLMQLVPGVAHIASSVSPLEQPSKRLSNPQGRPNHLEIYQKCFVLIMENFSVMGERLRNSMSKELVSDRETLDRLVLTCEEAFNKLAAISPPSPETLKFFCRLKSRLSYESAISVIPKYCEFDIRPDYDDVRSVVKAWVFDCIIANDGSQNIVSLNPAPIFQMMLVHDMAIDPVLEDLKSHPTYRDYFRSSFNRYLPSQKLFAITSLVKSGQLSASQTYISEFENFSNDLWTPEICVTAINAYVNQLRAGFPIAAFAMLRFLDQLRNNLNPELRPSSEMYSTVYAAILEVTLARIKIVYIDPKLCESITAIRNDKKFVMTLPLYELLINLTQCRAALHRKSALEYHEDVGKISMTSLARMCNRLFIEMNSNFPLWFSSSSSTSATAAAAAKVVESSSSITPLRSTQSSISSSLPLPKIRRGVNLLNSGTLHSICHVQLLFAYVYIYTYIYIHTTEINFTARCTVLWARALLSADLVLETITLYNQHNLKPSGRTVDILIDALIRSHEQDGIFAYNRRFESCHTPRFISRNGGYFAHKAVDIELDGR